MPRTAPYSPHTPARVRLDDGSERDVPARMSLDEFSRFPWPQKEAWELIWEVPVLAPRPRWKHQSLMVALLGFIEDHLPTNVEYLVLPEVDVRLSAARSWVVPDIAVFAADDVDEEARPLELTPALAIEIISPSTASIDVGPKRDAYSEAGTPEYWTVHPELGAVAVHVMKDGEYQVLSTDADGFVASPFLGCSLRVVRDGKKFRVLNR